LPVTLGGFLSALHVSQVPQPVGFFKGMSSMEAALRPNPSHQQHNPHTQTHDEDPHAQQKDGKPYVDGPHRTFGLSRPLYAWIFGTLSGISLPIGALLGIKFSPVPDHYCAAMMAFGAGCLLFAVTVELYAHSLHELTHGNIGYLEMGVQTLGALGGAYFYLWMNRWLETAFSEHSVPDPRESSGLTDSHGRVARTFSLTNYQLIMKMKGNDTPRGERTAKEKARRHWSNIRTVFRLRKLVDYWQSKTLDMGGVRGREIGMRVLANEMQKTTTMKDVEESDGENPEKAKMVALALFLGLLVDGVPEGVLVGFLSAEGHFSPVLIISLLLANFPEACSSASLMISAGMSTPVIVGMWGGLCALVGSLSGFACWALLALYPTYGQEGVKLPQSVLVGISLVEGITGGAMIACISSVMLPEAFERTKKDGPLRLSSGFLCTVGFLVSTVMKALGG